MVLLEAAAVIAFATESAALKQDPLWIVLLKLLGAVLVILLVGYFARHFTRLFQKSLESTTHWRTHLVILVVLAICALVSQTALFALGSAGMFLSIGAIILPPRANGTSAEAIPAKTA